MNQNLLPLLILGVPAFGLLLRAVMFLIYGVRGPTGNQARIYSWVRGLGAFIFIGSIILMLLPIALFLGGFLILFGGYALIEFLQARRDLQRQAVWSVLVNSQHQNRSLEEVLAIHAPRFSGFVGKAYRQLQKRLNEGASLPVAISENRRCIPTEALATVSLCANQPLSSDPRLAGILPYRVTNMWTRIYFFYSYFFSVATGGLGVLTFLMIAIIPAFEAIFTDFELELPGLTQSLIRTSNIVVGSGIGALLLLCLSLLSFCIVPVFICYLVDVPILRSLLDRVGWFKHQSQILYLFAEAISRKQSFTDTISRLVAAQPGYGSKLAVKRLEKAELLASAGHNWIDSLYRAKIIRKQDIGPLETASQAGNITWVLRRISDDILERSIVRWGIVEKTILPLGVVLFGVVIGWVVIGLFIPLVHLIECLV